EVEDILIYIAVPSNVTLPPDSRFRVTVKDNNGAPRVIVTDETIVSLASSGLYPDSVSLPVVWQLQIEFLAGSGGDLFLPMCFPDQLHTFVGDSFAVPSPAPTIVGTPPTPADTSAPTVTNISVKPTTVPIKSGTVSISAIVADPSGVATVMVYYRTSGGKWFSARMTLAGGRYTAVLSQFGTAGKWEFHIRAVDRVGNENCSIAKRSACPGGSFVVTPP
ncbi:MAG: hypothetical protein OEV06_00935, partial [Anaerolineae bacterium]|nr:hypothetical protein [Anaerolineae bacterium]